MNTLNPCGKQAGKDDFDALSAAINPTLEAREAEIAALSARVAELEAEKLASLEAGKREWDYYQATTCPCQAAERYVPDCPKHGRATQTHSEDKG